MHTFSNKVKYLMSSRKMEFQRRVSILVLGFFCARKRLWRYLSRMKASFSCMLLVASGFLTTTPARLDTQSLDPYLNSAMVHFAFSDESLSSPSSEESERQLRSVHYEVVPRKVEGVLRSASSSASQTSVIRDWSSRLLSSYSHT